VHRTIHVQVVHRHGDRSPITPLRDERYWADKLVPASTAREIARNTRIVRGDPSAATKFRHGAGGRGPFGRLTQLGLLQMIQVGTALRERFVAAEESSGEGVDGNSLNGENSQRLWTDEKPLRPSSIRVFSTDFERTIQSVQGTLIGLFPLVGKEENEQDVIDIDVRNTEWMIPDPQPRRHKEQEELEVALAGRPHILAEEREMLDLALKTTEALRPMLADDAHEVSFGVDQESIVAQEHPGEQEIEIEPLVWNQLAEICKCLSVHGLLPKSITGQDLEKISQHTARRWFQNLRHPRLARLAMGKMADEQVKIMLQRRNDERDGPCMTIWSAHDSTLIGLLCAYRLQQPLVWPEYASCLLIELIEVSPFFEDRNGDSSDPAEKDYVVRFTLNGEVLKSMWDDDDESGAEPRETISLSYLAQKLANLGVEESDVI